MRRVLGEPCAEVFAGDAAGRRDGGARASAGTERVAQPGDRSCAAAAARRCASPACRSGTSTTRSRARRWSSTTSAIRRRSRNRRAATEPGAARHHGRRPGARGAQSARRHQGRGATARAARPTQARPRRVHRRDQPRGQPTRRAGRGSADASARRPSRAWRQLNIHRVIQQVVGVIEPRADAAPASASSSASTPACPTSTADDAQLSQVFLNVVRNALEAMAGARPGRGGRRLLTISTRMETDFHLLRDAATRSGKLPARRDRRPGQRHRRRHGGADVRALLHHQGARHRPRPGDLAQDRRRARRHHPRRAQPSARHGDHRQPAGRTRAEHGRPARNHPGGGRRGLGPLGAGQGLESAGHTVVQAERRTRGPRAPARAAASTSPSSTSRMPDIDGSACWRAAREAGVTTPIVIVTAQNTMDNAIEAMKRGAYDYIAKPFNIDEVRAVASRALEMARLSTDLQPPRARDARALRGRRRDRRQQPGDAGDLQDHRPRREHRRDGARSRARAAPARS